MINKSIAILFLFLLPTAMFSQDLGDIIFGKDSKVSYIGQYTDNHKHQSGIGIMRLKKGAVYIGDFNMDKFSGKGMLIAGQEGIKNCPGAAFYVGGFFNNVKNRKGTCYAANGDIIYKGRFEDDAPVDTYPSPNPNVEDYYTMMEMGDELYWGEVTSGTPNGSALVLEADGSLWVGEYKNGVRSGLCLTCFDNENWEAGKWLNGTYTAFDNTNVSQVRNQNRKTAQRRAYSEMWSSLMDVSVHILENSVEIAKAGSGKNSANGSASDDNIATGKSLDYYMAQYKKWESRAKNCFENRVSKKLGAKTTMDHQVANGEAKNLRSYQRLMRQVRMAAQKSGYSIPISTYENESF